VCPIDDESQPEATRRDQHQEAAQGHLPSQPSRHRHGSHGKAI
jgi:hypothetical protein